MRKIYIDVSELKWGLRNPVVLLAQGFGSGCINPFPGTWGTISALLIYVLVVHIFSLDQSVWTSWVLAASALGIPLTSYAERVIGRKDPFSIVWDEWCGIWLAFLYLPFSATLLVLGFLLFRILDTRKPWIIGMADARLKAGAGIMLDDIIAGITVNVVLQAILLLTMSLGISLP